MADIGHNSVGIVQTKIIRLVEADRPLELDCGKKLAPIDVAYETYGQLNEDCDNAILICHALSGTLQAITAPTIKSRAGGILW
jgi:homoserine O-acetyltransferase